MTEGGPPGLRIQEKVHGPCCRFCINYDGNARCKRYDVMVAPDTQCNSFASIFASGERQFTEP